MTWKDILKEDTASRLISAFKKYADFELSTMIQTGAKEIPVPKKLSIEIDTILDSAKGGWKDEFLNSDMLRIAYGFKTPPTDFRMMNNVWTFVV